MAMHVNLSPDAERYIAGQVKEGAYRSADEAVDAAIQRMRQQMAEFRRAIAEGEAELDRGEGRELTPELMGELEEAARRDMASRQPIDPDVLP